LTEVSSGKLGKTDLVTRDDFSPYTYRMQEAFGGFDNHACHRMAGSKAAAGARAGKLSSPSCFYRHVMSPDSPLVPDGRSLSCGDSSRSSGPLRYIGQANMHALRSGICSPTATNPPAHARRRILEPAKSTAQQADNTRRPACDLHWMAQ
jgi:hypothetical protein